MKRLGFSFDYDRVFYSSDESQYRWSQWLFLTLLEAGLIYRDDATVDWCDTCQTTLAAIQVEDGRCWRCHNPVRLIRRPTWFLRITPYLEENDRNLERLENWDELSLATQRYILGRSDGVEVDLPAPAAARADRLHAARATRSARRASSCSRRATPRSSAGPPTPTVARASSTRCARAAGSAAPATPRRCRSSTPAPRSPGPAGGELPVFVSPIVDARYGPTAALGIPAVDEADEAIAGADAARAPRPRRRPRRGAGGRAPARRSATAPTTSRSPASASGARRSRSSTARAAAPVPVPVEDLPVVLPRDIEPTGEGNPLAERPDFVDVACPRCGEPAKRETDTLDCHFDALWLWVPAAVPPEARDEADVHPPRPAALAALRAPRRRRRQRRLRLRPAGRDQGAARHRPVRLPRRRRALRRLPLPRDGDRRRAQDEQAPRQRRRPRRAGRALRRRHRAPRRPLRGRAGEDAQLDRRRAALRQPLPATASGTTRTTASPRSRRRRDDAEAAADTEFMRERLGKWCDNGVARITADLEELQMHKAVRNVTRLFERIQDFEKRVVERRGAARAAPTPRRWSRRWCCSRGCSPPSPRTSPRSC